MGTRYVEYGAAGDGVAVIPLDDMLPSLLPAVIKVDVEGADLQALLGMEGMIKRAHPRLIVVEADDALLARFGDSVASISAYMRTLGYCERPIGEKWHAPSIAFSPGKLG